MLKQKYAETTLVATFIIYFISVLLQSNFRGNLLSPVVAFLSSLVIYLSLKNIKDFRICWLFLLFYTISWGVADFIWLLYDNFFHINPVNVASINALYTVPNLLLMVSITCFYALNLKKWNLYQLVLDMLAISAILAILLWSFIFSKTPLHFQMNFEYINTMTYIFFDFYIISGMSAAFISAGIKKMSRRYFLVIAGTAVVTFIDYYYAYIYLMKLYHENTIIDGIYMMGNVLFALGAAYEAAHFSNQEKTETKYQMENIRKPKKLILLFVLFYYLYIVGFFSLRILIISLGVYLLYWILTKQIQEGIQNKNLLKAELEINEQLEKLVTERTQELRLANKNLEELSNRDSLTGLYNRRQLIESIDSLIFSKIENSFALLYIDANHFKAINDSYGHQTGDEVLRALGNRLVKNCMPHCKVFRVGGDEFAVIVGDNVGKEYICSVAERILELIQMPILVDSYFFTITASIGIVSYPEDAKDKFFLMRYADIAMYEAKNTYKGNNYMFFDAELSKKIERKNEIGFLLRRADYDKELVLYYQPQYNTQDHSLVGMEALLRWIQPEKGFIGPGEFIPIAEESGDIIEIGEWVINRAMDQIKKWNETFSSNLKVSINVSPLQIQKSNFVSWFREKLYEKNVDAQWIDLEITEGSAMAPDSANEEVFASFAQMGVTTSIDDFGTGYASLHYIKKFDFNRLKIAKELIDNIYEDKNAKLIVQAIIMMAKGMGLKTIAEGVEDMKQFQILKMLNCDEIQGYIFGKPVPAEEFEREHLNNKMNKHIS